MLWRCTTPTHRWVVCRMVTCQHVLTCLCHGCHVSGSDAECWNVKSINRCSSGSSRDRPGSLDAKHGLQHGMHRWSPVGGPSIHCPALRLGCLLWRVVAWMGQPSTVAELTTFLLVLEDPVDGTNTQMVESSLADTHQVRSFATTSVPPRRAMHASMAVKQAWNTGMAMLFCAPVMSWLRSFGGVMAASRTQMP